MNPNITNNFGWVILKQMVKSSTFRNLSVELHGGPGECRDQGAIIVGMMEDTGGSGESNTSGCIA